MKYKVMCQTCGTELKIRSLNKYLRIDGRADPTIKVFVESCLTCLNRKASETCRNIFHSPKHGW